MNTGAGDGNRTHVTSLEGWNSTIELHPQVPKSTLIIISDSFSEVKHYFEFFSKQPVTVLMEKAVALDVSSKVLAYYRTYYASCQPYFSDFSIFFSFF